MRREGEGQGAWLLGAGLPPPLTAGEQQPREPRKGQRTLTKDGNVSPCCVAEGVESEDKSHLDKGLGHSSAAGGSTLAPSALRPHTLSLPPGPWDATLLGAGPLQV